MARMQELYEKKGYPKKWIDKRLRGIAVREDLTDEWKNRGARATVEYAILTNEIMQGAFDPHHAGRSDDHQIAPGPGFARPDAAEERCPGRRCGGRQDAEGH